MKTNGAVRAVCALLCNWQLGAYWPIRQLRKKLRWKFKGLSEDWGQADFSKNPCASFFNDDL
jgi:hypothetical protein